MKKIAWLLTLFMLFLPLITLDYRPVMAHVEMVQGDIRILAGWTNEPPLVDQLNEIIIIVTRVSDGQPINNALSQVAVTVNKGAESKSLQFQPAEESGTYTSEILPTEPGQYAVVMNGTIAGQAIDGQIQIEDVEDTARFTFPPATSASSNEISQEVIEQLQTVITGLTAQIDEANAAAEDARNASLSVTESAQEARLAADRAYLFGMIGIGVGAAGIAIAVVALSRKDVVTVSRRQKL